MVHRAAARPQDLERDIAAADGVVNATQVGMRGFPGNPVPVAAHQGQTLGRRRHLHTDANRIPRAPPLAKGARVLNGGGMCVHQAVATFRCFTGVTPDVARLHRAFATAVAARDAALATAS